MSKAKVAKTDNIMYFAHLVKQVSDNLDSDLFVYYELGLEPILGMHLYTFYRPVFQGKVKGRTSDFVKLLNLTSLFNSNKILNFVKV